MENKDQPLFRLEVLEARSAEWLGETSNTRALSFYLIALAAVAAAAAIVVFAVWGTYTRKVRASGYVVPSSGPCAAPSTATCV